MLTSFDGYDNKCEQETGVENTAAPGLFMRGAFSSSWFGGWLESVGTLWLELPSRLNGDLRSTGFCQSKTHNKQSGGSPHGSLSAATFHRGVCFQQQPVREASDLWAGAGCIWVPNGWMLA